MYCMDPNIEQAWDVINLHPATGHNLDTVIRLLNKFSKRVNTLRNSWRTRRSQNTQNTQVCQLVEALSAVIDYIERSVERHVRILRSRDQVFGRTHVDGAVPS